MLSGMKMTTAALALTTAFGATAQAAQEMTSVAWDPSPTPAERICAYEVMYKTLPGFIGQTGTKSFKVSGETRTASFPIDPALTTQVIVRAIGVPPGQTCATTPTRLASVFSNIIDRGGSFRAYGGQAAADVDGDGLSDLQESPGGPDVIQGKTYYHTYTNMFQAQTTTACPWANDREMRLAADSIRPNSWVNPADPSRNGLNDPNRPIFKKACDIVKTHKTTTIPLLP